MKFQHGTQFRISATKRLCEYIVKGFTLDDEHLKRAAEAISMSCSRASATSVAEGLLAKGADIYATGIDYDLHVEAAQGFFATVQNKMYWATHDHTADEVNATHAPDELDR